MNKQQFIEYKTQYLNALPSGKKSEQSVKQYAMILRNFENFLSDTAEITPLVVVQWRVALFDSGICNNTVRSYLVCLHTFYHWAVRMGLEQSNPVHEEEIPELQQVEYDLLNNEEIKRLLTFPATGIFAKTACRNRAIIVLLLQSGLRNSELRSLRLCDLDWQNCTITVRHGKGDKCRQIPFPALARRYVELYLNSGIRPEWVTDDDWLFGTDADEQGQSTDGNVWHQFSCAGLVGLVRRYTEHCCGHSVKTHALRHAYTSLCDDLGVPIGEVSKTLGHASISLTEKTYLHVLNRDKAAKNATAALDNMVLV